ncbi:MAG: helix-turn-helix transcriptional regulator [Anaerolineales bacterium]|nr:helix-turn-helix transcriptional regulator [Anaerolineales bacterium]
MNVQIIERDGKPEWAVIPYELYLQLAEEAEMLQDIGDYDAVRMKVERGEEELIPSDVVYAIMDGENPIKAWREYRQLTQQQLAQAVGISTPYLSQLERGKRTGTTEVLTAMAKVLKVSLDEIIVLPEKDQ